MTSDRDIERLLDAWLTDGPLRVADRVIDDAAARIAHQPQRRAWRLLWRDQTMNADLKPILAVAAVVLVTVVGVNILSAAPSGIGGPAPTTSPSPTPTSTPTPTPVVRSLPDGILAAGTYRATPFRSTPELTVTLTVPAGWTGFQNWAILGPNGTGAPTGIGVGFLKVDGVFSDPCHWDADGTGSFTQLGDVEVGPTVDDLVAALRANSSYVVTTPAAVTLSGFAGQRLDIQMPTDLDPTTCDRGPGDPTGLYYVFTGANGEGGLYAQGPRQIYHEWILDVAGQRMLVGYNDYATTPAAEQAAAQAIIDSMVIEP
jgi:hypothetical protein